MICGDRDDLHHGQDSDGANAVTVAYRLHCLRFVRPWTAEAGGRVLATIEALSDEEDER
jgi:hypothetical protein